MRRIFFNILLMLFNNMLSNTAISSHVLSIVEEKQGAKELKYFSFHLFFPLCQELF